MAELEKYRPANGTEGEGFMENYCYQCLFEKWSHTQNENDVKCEILTNVMIYDFDDPNYPAEWTYKDGHPTCTKWQKWDWGIDDHNNDGLNEPPPPEPYDPNQLMFPFMVDEFLKEEELVETEERG